jgi:glycine cleavage system H protein
MAMTEFLEATVDKFTFRVPTDRHYSSEGLWAQEVGGRIRIGLTDFLQQRSGDVAFAELKAAGATLKTGDEFGTIETIKVNISLTSPINAKMVEVNPAMEATPEAINQDPYGAGWLALLEPVDWKRDQAALLDPQAYFALMRDQAEKETRKS